MFIVQLWSGLQKQISNLGNAIKREIKVSLIYGTPRVWNRIYLYQMGQF